MDRRLHDRLPLNLEARVINITESGRRDAAVLSDVTAAGICLRMSAPASVGDLVRVEFPEGTAFGQVIYMTAESSGFRCGVEVFDVLLGESDLARLIQQTLRPDTSDPRPAAEPPQALH